MKKTNTRIYLIKDRRATADVSGEPVALVRATSKAAAINHAVRRDFSADVASAEDLVDLVGNGWRVEDAGEEEPLPPQSPPPEPALFDNDPTIE